MKTSRLANIFPESLRCHIRKTTRFCKGKLLLAVVGVAVVSMAATSRDDESTTYEELKTLRFDDTRIADVEDLHLRRHEFELVLQSGRIYLSRAVAGRVTGAVFVGSGHLRFRPPNDLEQQQLHRFMDKDTLDEAFSQAYLRFLDGTADTLFSTLEWHSGNVPPNVEDMHQHHTRLLLERRGWNLTSRILDGLLSTREDGFFFAALQAEEYEFHYPPWFYLVVDPQAEESAGLLQHFEFRIKKPFYVLASYRPGGDPRDSESFMEPYHITHYDMYINLMEPKTFDGRVSFVVVPNQSGSRLLRFDLSKDARVDSACGASGEPLAIFQEEDESGFALALPSPTRAGVAETLTVHYRGDLLEQSFSGHYHLKDREQWYPRIGYLKRATFDMHFRYPDKYDIVAVGRQDTVFEEGRQKIDHWLETFPAKVAAFTLGRFDLTEVHPKGLPRIRVFSSGLRSETMRKRIAGDIGNSLYLYQSLLAPYPADELRVTEAAGIVSQGFPGLIYLTALTYETELEGVMEALRSHEVSHQWWGNLVGWHSYHDQWLSEGLAEYSGALFVEMSLRERRRYAQLLKAWRDDILERGNVGVSAGMQRFGFSKQDLARSEGSRAGPVWMGIRLGLREGVDYYVTVYEKGAYIIHMLRMMLRDYATGSDRKFWSMLHEYVHRFSGADPTTADFQEVAEEYYGGSLEWFFRQWVYGTETPTLDVEKGIESTPAGQFRVVLRVEQGDVSSPFRLTVPVTIEFPSGDRSTYPVNIEQWQQQLSLGPFDEHPSEVIFNDLGGVLARVHE